MYYIWSIRIVIENAIKTALDTPNLVAAAGGGGATAVDAATAAAVAGCTYQ